MDRTELIMDCVRDLIEKYSNDSETQKRFCEKASYITFLVEGDESYDEEISRFEKEAYGWKRKMPPLSCDNVEVFLDEDNLLILSVTGTDCQMLNELYTVVTEQIVDDLCDNPDIIKLAPTHVGNGEGDEGCIYFEFGNEEGRNSSGTFFEE